jgi:hypothetical protein
MKENEMDEYVTCMWEKINMWCCSVLKWRKQPIWKTLDFYWWKCENVLKEV